MPICLLSPWWNIKGLSTVLASTRKHCCFSRPPTEETHNSACCSPRDHQEVLDTRRCIQLSKTSSACLFRKKEGEVSVRWICIFVRFGPKMWRLIDSTRVKVHSTQQWQWAASELPAGSGGKYSPSQPIGNLLRDGNSPKAMLFLPVKVQSRLSFSQDYKWATYFCHYNKLCSENTDSLCGKWSSSALSFWIPVTRFRDRAATGLEWSVSWAITITEQHCSPIFSY